MEIPYYVEKDETDYKRVNNMLCSYYPELSNEIEEERKYWFPEEPGGHILYGNVFNPFAISVLEKGNKKDINKLLRFLSLLQKTDDDYVQNVLCVTILEKLIGTVNYGDFKNKEYLLRNLIRIFDDVPGEESSVPIIQDMDRYRDKN